MRAIRYISLVIFVVITGLASAPKNIYITTGGEWIFSWAGANQKGYDIAVITR